MRRFLHVFSCRVENANYRVNYSCFRECVSAYYKGVVIDGSLGGGERDLICQRMAEQFCVRSCI